MSSSIEQPDDLMQLLRSKYDVAPPDQDFTSRLLHRLKAEIAGTPDQFAGGSQQGRIAFAGAKAWWRYGAVAAAAAVVVIAVVLVVKVSTHHAGADPQIAQKPEAPVPGDSAATPLLPRVPEAGHSVTMGVLSLEDQIGRIPLIVRAQSTGWKDGIVDFAILHVVYGRCSDKSIKLDLSAQIGFGKERARDKMIQEGIKEPEEPALTERALVECGIGKGKDVIFELMPFAGHPAAEQGIKFISYGMSYDVPPSLNNREKAIIQAIAKGKYLEPHPQPGDVLMDRMHQATLIVRAILIQVGESGGTWKIIRTIKGRADKDTLIVNFDLFRLRAEAIVNYELRTGQFAAQAATRPTNDAVEARIVAEEKRLMQAELIPGSEAILFLDEAKTKADGIHVRMRHRLYGDQEKKNLDELEKAIVSPSNGVNL